MVLSLSLKQLVQVADNRTSLKDHNYEHILEHFSSHQSEGGVSDVRSFEVTWQTFLTFGFIFLILVKTTL